MHGIMNIKFLENVCTLALHDQRKGSVIISTVSCCVYFVFQLKEMFVNAQTFILCI